LSIGLYKILISEDTFLQENDDRK